MAAIRNLQKSTEPFKPHNMTSIPNGQSRMNTLQRWTLKGRIQPSVTKTYPLTGLTDALADLHHRQVTGKLALEILGDIKK
jgi:NADPH2:quinone reductase